MMKRTKNPKAMHKISFAFFGTAPLALGVLDALEAAGYLPALVVAGPDTIEPRKKTIIFPPEKSWAIARGIEAAQPAKIDADFIARLKAKKWDVFIVASYGKILPRALLEIPAHGVLNMHPSLLPRLRGPSPIRSAILNDERETGVSVILLDEKMDHGPIIAQKKIIIPDWPPSGAALDSLLAREGGTLLAAYLPKWIAGEIEAHEQNHDLATFCKMFAKEDGLIGLHDGAYQNLLKIRAYEGWPGTHAFFENGGRQKIRVKILDAHLENGALKIDRVIPEGKREMRYEEFLRSGAKPL
jgi:methionyl-tRNA formyltransferase